MDWLEIIFTVYALVLNLFSVMDIWLLLTIFFGCDLKLTNRNLALTAGLFLIFDVILSFVFYQQENRGAFFQIFLIFLFIIVGAFCLAREKRFKAILFSFPAVLLYIMCSNIFTMLDTLLGLEQFAVAYEEVGFTPLEGISDFLIFLILFFILRKGKRQKWSLTLTVGEGIGIMGFALLFFALKSFFESLAKDADGSFIKEFGYIVLIIMNFVILYAIMYRKLAGYYKNTSDNYKEQFEEEYSYFQEYKDKQQDTARFRHDWKNHMLVLQKMLQDGDYGKAEEYFEGLSGKTGLPVQTILTGNEMLDMLLCMKEEECRAERIAVSMDGTLSALPAISPVDSSILFSNLLDNAIEANSQVMSERFIRIRARTVNEVLYFEMENPMKEALRYDGTQVVTTKQDSAAHGFGLKNVEEIVTKYQGQYQIQEKEHIFLMQIIFPVKE
ncbi:MAG: GHKL domain-containing protein [Bacteroides sp.]|nr:GHKL domain-containing protein [Bacteroides sp.]MCM1550721.1 GHKL domain-containing protein [Clostridium sp.]